MSMNFIKSHSATQLSVEAENTGEHLLLRLFRHTKYVEQFLPKVSISIHICEHNPTSIDSFFDSTCTNGRL